MGNHFLGGKIDQKVVVFITPPSGVRVMDTSVAKEDGMIQVYVPEGHFLMGSVPENEEAEDDEKPQRSVCRLSLKDRHLIITS